MRSGGATLNMATWRMMICGVNFMTLGFPAVFQFFGIEILFFPSLFPFLQSFLLMSFCLSCSLVLLFQLRFKRYPVDLIFLVFELLISKVCSSFSLSLFLFLHNLFVNFLSFFFFSFFFFVPLLLLLFALWVFRIQPPPPQLFL